MSSISVHPDVRKKLAYISKNFPKLNLPDKENLWLIEDVESDYSWSASAFGVDNQGNIIVATDEGCSCNGPWEDGKNPDERHPITDPFEKEVGYDFYTEDHWEERLESIVQGLYKALRYPKTIKAEEILNVENLEIRRAIIDLVGYDPLVKAAAVLDEDPAHGRLLRIEQKVDEPITLLQVKDASTPREYFLRVPPDMKTAAQARAWTFGLTPETFAPEIET